MPEYRRNRVPGGCYFFTVNLLNRSSRLLVDEVDTLRLAVRAVKARLPFHVDAWAVLPDHMHCVWTLPSGDADFSDRWRRIKAAFSQKIARGEIISASRRCHSERGIWQRRYWEHTIRDDLDYATHVDYTHFNPVKHGLVERPSDWQFSSFRRCVARGVYAPDWDCVAEGMGNAGEREQ